MSIKDNLLQGGIKHLSGILGPYLDSFGDPELRKALLESRNITLPPGTGGTPVSSQTVANIEAYEGAIDPDLIEFFNAVDDARKIIDSIRDVAAAAKADGFPGTLDEISRQILSELTLNYLHTELPWIPHLMRILGVLEEKLDDHYANRLFWERFAAFAKDAAGYFEQRFTALQTEEDAHQLANMFFFPTAAILDYKLGKKGFVASYRWDASPDSATPRADTLADRTLSVFIPMPEVGGDGSGADFALIASMTFVPKEHGGPGLMMAVGGEAQIDIPITTPIDNDAADKDQEETVLNLRIELEAPSGGIVFIPFGGDTTLNTFSASKSLDLKTTLEPKGEFKHRILGSSKGTRIEFGKPKLLLRFRKMPDRKDFLFDVRVQAQESRFVLSPGDGDSFIKGILPPGDMSLKLDPGVGLRKGEDGDWGAYLVGGDSLEVALPGGVKLGPAELKELKTRLKPKGGDGTGTQTSALTGGDGQAALPEAPASNVGVEVEVTANFSIKMGPLTAVLDDVGIRFGLEEAEDGNLGLMDVVVGYKPPAGVGVAIDGAVKGGGYLFFDTEKKQYAGIVMLKFEKITFNAVGLLTTRMPDGSEGFSLLLMITAEDFPPINVGLGFQLVGIGGLIGYNRSVNVDILRTGLKNKTLDSILFPEDPIRNAAAIVSNVRKVFPPTRGQHVIGPVAKLTWGTNSVLTFDIGLIIEFPNPVRLVILGQMRALLPSKTKALIQLNMDVFGAIDFDKGEALVLATLYDSKLLAWNISGDAAFYARWEGDATFILSAGGFHPAFPAPRELPALDRVMMVLSKGDSVKMTMTFYLALTSNTFQHGAKLTLLVKGGGFSIDGHLGYDVLIQFDPFGFVVSFSAGVGLKFHGRTLASVQLEGSLSGPSPWHVKGKATFKIWIFSKSVSFDKTLGRGETLPPMPVVNPKPALLQALADPANWAAALPPNSDSLVTLRKTPEDGSIRVHPLGEVAVQQRVLPLDVPITKFGNARLSGTQRFRIDGVDFNGTAAPSRVPVVDHFSPGQFQELSQGEQLSRPSFEEMPAGMRIKTDALTFGGASTADASHRRTTTLAYETKILTEDETTGETVTTSQPEAYHPDERHLDIQTQFGAAGRSTVQLTARFAAVKPAAVKVHHTEFIVARTDDLAAVAVDVDGEDGPEDEIRSLSAMLSRLQEHIRRHPEDAGRLQVVPTFEVEKP